MINDDPLRIKRGSVIVRYCARPSVRARERIRRHVNEIRLESLARFTRLLYTDPSLLLHPSPALEKKKSRNESRKRSTGSRSMTVQLHWPRSLFFFQRVIAPRFHWPDTRYRRVTVKLSVLLTRSRIWGIPSTIACQRSIPVQYRNDFPLHDKGTWRAMRECLLSFVST